MYPQKLLADGETVQFEMRPHFRALLAPMFWLLVTVGCLVLAAAIVPLLAPLFLVAAAIIFLTGALVPFLRWFTTTYTFTNRRIIVRSGLVSRTGRDVPLDKINNVSFHVSVFGRILNYGTLSIESAANNGDLVIKDVPNVETVQRDIYRLAENTHDQDST